MLAESRTFNRYNSTDETLEFRTPGPNAATLAYVDHNADGTADVVVFNPYKGTRRHYDGRTPARALGIVARHLASEGYDMPALEAAAAPEEAPAGSKWEVVGNGEVHGAYATPGAAQAMADRMNEASDVRDAAGRIIPVFHVQAPEEAAPEAPAAAPATASPYDVKRGDKFTYGADTFEAVADATGEHNAYCRVWNPRRQEVTEILMRHGSTVTLSAWTVAFKAAIEVTSAAFIPGTQLKFRTEAAAAEMKNRLAAEGHAVEICGNPVWLRVTGSK